MESLEEDLENAFWSKLLALRDGGQIVRARECLDVALKHLPHSEKLRKVPLTIVPPEAEDSGSN